MKKRVEFVELCKNRKIIKCGQSFNRSQRIVIGLKGSQNDKNVEARNARN